MGAFEGASCLWAQDLALSQLAKAHSIIASGKLPAIQAIHLALKAVQVKLDRARELLEGSQGDVTTWPVSNAAREASADVRRGHEQAVAG